MLVAGITNSAGDGGAIHVNIKHIEKNTDSRALDAVVQNWGNRGYFSVSRGNNRPGFAGYHSVGIAEEPQEKSRQQESGRRPRWTDNPGNQATRGQHRQTVIVAFWSHESLLKGIIEQ